MTEDTRMIAQKITILSSFCVFLGLFIYIILRALMLSYTHDESLTFTILNGDKFWVLTANNHWLNTILSYVSARIFGYSEIALRLPNVLSFLLYSYFCFNLVIKHSKSITASIIAAIFLLSNHYLLEFFSLSRGYGLALGFFSGALYYFIQLSESRVREHRILVKGIIFSLCAIYANYSFVIPVAAIQFAYLICLYRIFRNEFTTTKQLFLFIARRLLWFLGEIILLLPALYNIIVLKERQQLYFGGKNDVIHDTLFSVFRSTFPVEYLPHQQWIILSIVVFIAIVSIFIKSKKNMLFIGIVFFVSMILPEVLHYTIDMKYPLGRAALYWIVILGVLFHGILEYVSDRHRALKLISFCVLACITVAAMSSNVKAWNLQYASSWRGDAATRAMLEFLDETRDTSRNCKLMTNWYFSAAVNYYKISKGYSWLVTASRKDWLIAKNKKAILAQKYDYFYVGKKGRQKLNDKIHVKDFNISNTVLFKNDTSH